MRSAAAIGGTGGGIVTTTYARYLKAARRKNVADPASIFEVAASDPDLTAKQLGQLAGELHHRHGFKLTKAQRDPLIDALIDAGMSPTEIAKRIGCNPRTVSRRQAAQVGVTDRLNKRAEPDKTASRDLPPILSFDARGGGDDVRVIRRMLWGGR